MELGLAGKTVIVTGGASNIGRAISLSFASEGSNVVVADIDEAQAKKVISEGKGLPGRMVLIKTDTTKPDQVEAMVKKTLEDFQKIDILVNNVGWTHDRLFIEKPREEWEREININLWSPINCTRAVLEHMIERKYGKIVSISSDAGRMGEFREAVYGACKGGIIAMSKAIAREVGRYGINLNVVCPGMTIPESPEEVGEKSMFKEWMGELITPEMMEKAARNYPLRRLGKAQDVANAVLFLASDAASFVTGQTFSVSGGYTMM